MNFIHPSLKTVLFSFIFLSFMLATPVLSDVTVTQDPDDSDLQIYKMTVTPAPEPSPVFKHRLTVPLLDTRPGNAAIHYLKFFVPENGFERWKKHVLEEHGEGEQDWDWHSIIHDLPNDEASRLLESIGSTVDNWVGAATLCRDCNWDHVEGTEYLTGPQIIGYLLPEMQSLRDISRVLALRTRVAIAKKDYEKAIEQLRMNYRLAENAGNRTPFLVCGLIGMAIANIGNDEVIELISAEGSPNLYWALAELPHPIVNIEDSLRFEITIGPRMFPFLQDAETANHVPEEWNRILLDAMGSFGEIGAMTSGNFLGFTIRSDAGLVLRKIGATGLSLVMYPDAKKRLIESGIAVENVEAMPVGQVLAIDGARGWRKIADEVEKLAYIPFHEAKKIDVDRLFDSASSPVALTHGYGFIFAGMLLPSLEACRSAEIRTDRQMRAIQAIEALRMHAAETGSLPESLGDVTIVPIPVNPATNQPFLYRLENKTAIIDLPESDGVRNAYRFEITLAEQ